MLGNTEWYQNARIMPLNYPMTVAKFHYGTSIQPSWINFSFQVEIFNLKISSHNQQLK